MAVVGEGSQLRGFAEAMASECERSAEEARVLMRFARSAHELELAAEARGSANAYLSVANGLRGALLAQGRD